MNNGGKTHEKKQKNLIRPAVGPGHGTGPGRHRMGNGGSTHRQTVQLGAYDYENSGAKGNVAPPAETFTFVLEDWVKEGETKRDLACYGITLEKLEIPTATGNKITKTFAVQIDPEKVNAENGWHGYGNNGDSESLRWFSKTFRLKEVDDRKAGWQYSDEEYAVTFQYTIETGKMALRIHVPGNDVYYDSAEFMNSYTENLTTVEIPFTKTVKLGGNTAPGKTDFELEIFDIGNSNKNEYKDVTYTAVVTTKGAGDYDGKLIISGPTKQVRQFVCEGFSVREVNDNLPRWTYSDAVWYVLPGEAEDENGIPKMNIYSTRNGEGAAEDQMTFVNTYKRNSTNKTTTPEKPISSPKTFDAGVALYGVSALLSLTGAALVIKRKNG